MSEAVVSTDGRAAYGPAIHPLYVRITHWINAIAIIIMIASGWEIYNASPLFPFTFPGSITLGGSLAGSLLWHFAAMWVLMANGLVYVALGIATGRFSRKFLPIRPADIARDASAFLAGRLSHDDITRYNAVQKALYLGVLIDGVLIVASGFAIWKPVQLQPLTALFGGFDTARLVHFVAMAAFVVFLPVHAIMALVVPRSLRAMIRGR